MIPTLTTETMCRWCGQPINEGQDFACFKQFGEDHHSFFHRRHIKNDCWSLFLIDHMKKVSDIELEQFS